MSLKYEPASEQMISEENNVPWIDEEELEVDGYAVTPLRRIDGHG